MAKRYDFLLALINEVRPKTIAEVGVHRARRSVLMCQQALIHRHHIAFKGYDVFDTKDAAFHETALNGKGVPTEAEARAKMMAQLPIDRVSWTFIVGDTKQTLHGQMAKADFVFIDGDHRVEMIEGDFKAFRGTAEMIVLDDYYRPDAAGRVPDLSLYGANRLVDSLPPSMVTILPSEDPVNVGGIGHLAVVRF